MCSFFSERMGVGDELGGLAHDMVSGSGGGRATSPEAVMTVADWHLLPDPTTLDPFQDPLLYDWAFLDPPDPMATISKPTVNGGGGDEEIMRKISSPRAPRIKTRKMQAKKVVCIPAPPLASTNKTSSGEVVPSDHWAWRKYGQKPIKGSPYPRAYYRCSSLKGCSARKQVERSTTEPNMLIVSYTSDHNHPWPKQRNALAGSTRSSHQTAKNPCLKISPPQLKEATSSSGTTQTAAKEEDAGEGDHRVLIHQSHEPMITVELGQSDAFITGWEELEVNPIEQLHFSKSFLGGERENKLGVLDPLSFFDWADSNSF